MKAEYSLLSDLTPKQLDRLFQLTLIGEGYTTRSEMGYLLEETDSVKKQVKVVRIKHGNKIIGWGYWHPDFVNNGQYTVGIYVDRNHRRKGCGTLIYKAIQRRTRKPLYVSRWSTVAKAFYDRLGAEPTMSPWCRNYE